MIFDCECLFFRVPSVVILGHLVYFVFASVRCLDHFRRAFCLELWCHTGREFCVNGGPPPRQVRIPRKDSFSCFTKRKAATGKYPNISCDGRFFPDSSLEMSSFKGLPSDTALVGSRPPLLVRGLRCLQGGPSFWERRSFWAFLVTSGCEWFPLLSASFAGC